MRITKYNLNEVLFENQDAWLLIEGVAIHTGTSFYYYYNTETTVRETLDIWYRAMDAEDEEDGSASLLNFPNRGHVEPLLVQYLQSA